jgi:hypothetical protein
MSGREKQTVKALGNLQGEETVTQIFKKGMFVFEISKAHLARSQTGPMLWHIF